jgi:hypothetical protein
MVIVQRLLMSSPAKFGFVICPRRQTTIQLSNNEKPVMKFELSEKMLNNEKSQC